MSPVFELVVRREHSLFTPTHHVTVASLDPVTVAEAFDLQGHASLTAAAEAAMERLRARGYRLTEAIAEHAGYATAHLARDERHALDIELAADLVADARAVARALPGLGSPVGAAEVIRLVDATVASAQAIRARADAVLSSDAAVESAALLDHAMSAVADAGSDPVLVRRHAEAAESVHTELDHRRAELGGQS